MISSRRTPRPALHLTLALALLLAQGMAVIHLAGHSSESRDEPAAPVQICAQCATLHALFTVAPGDASYWMMIPLVATEALPAAVAFVLPAEPAHAFLSRGPPSTR